MMGHKALPEGLLADIKNYLDITWEDEATDTKVSGLIAAGMAYLNQKYGGEADYLSPGLPRTLLMDYVRYARDNALEVFENNFIALLLGMQHERTVTAYVESTEQAADGD